MAISVTNLRAKAVEQALAPLFVRSNYIHDQVEQRESNGTKEVHTIPGIGSLTVAESGASDVSAQSVSDDSLNLSIDRNPMVNIELPYADSVQNLDSGDYANQLAMQAATQLRNKIDKDMATYLGRTIAYDSSATYHTNTGGAKLTAGMLLEAIAGLKSNDGVVRPALFVHPFGAAGIMNIGEFIPNFQLAEMGDLGIPMLGSVFGVPVFETNSVERSVEVASTAWDITSNVLTITVGSGHGLVPGMKITFDTVTAGGDMSTATAIDSVTDTTIVVNHTASDGSATEAGTITATTAMNLLVDRAHTFAGLQRQPQVRFVDQQLRSGSHLQVWALWGRVARSARVRVIHTDADSVVTS